MRRRDHKRTRPSQSKRSARGLRKPQQAKDVRQPKRSRKTQKAKDIREPGRFGKVRDAKRSRAAVPATALPAGHSARERRTRELMEVGTRGGSFVFRHRAGNAVIFALLMVAAAQLFVLQVTNAPTLRAQAAGQLKVTDVTKAVRGSIVDRRNEQLAFTTESRALTFQPKRIRTQLEEAKKKNSAAPTPTSGCATSPKRSRAG